MQYSCHKLSSVVLRSHRQPTCIYDLPSAAIACTNVVSAPQVRLTLLKHLLAYHLPQTLPTLGATYATARVLRADKALGLLLRLSGAPDAAEAATTAAAAAAQPLAYAHISNVADGDAVPSNLAAQFPPGREVRAKVTGFRVMDGLATVSLRESDLAATSAVTWSTLVAGDVLEGTVAAVEEAGVLVQLAPAVRGLVPLAHVSEAAAPKNLKSRFKAGQTLRVRCACVPLLFGPPPASVLPFGLPLCSACNVARLSLECCT